MFLSLLYPFSGIVISYALAHQNKFLFLVYWTSLIVIVSLQLLLGSLAISATATPAGMDYTFQRSCLVNANMQNPDVVEACKPFFKSDYYAGILLVWKSYYFYSQYDLRYALDLQDLQRSGFCCGLGPPVHCQEDLDTFPSSLPSNNVFLEYPEKTKCSKILVRQLRMFSL